MNKKGISVVAAIVITMSIAYISIKTLTTLIPTIQKQKNQNKAFLDLSSLLNGLLDFTSYAIEQRWCLTDTFGRDIECSSGSQPGPYFDHPGNTEIFLLNKLTKDQIKAKFGYEVNDDPKMVKELKLDFPEGHPLNVVSTERIKKCFSHAKVSIFKDHSSSRKKEGDEAFVWIEVELVKPLLSSVVGGSSFCKLYKKHSARLLKIFTPRTLNGYGLIVTGDLDLQSLRSPKEGEGLKFYSPVYVGGDIDIGPKTGYSNTSFMAPAHIEGTLLEGGKLYKPGNYGGIGNQFQNEYKQLGGFMSGLVLEPEADEGLPYLFDSSAPKPDYSNMIECAKRNALRADPSTTAESNLFIRKKGNLDYILSLSKRNEFIPIEISQENKGSTYPSDKGILLTSQSGTALKSVVELKLKSISNSSWSIDWTQGSEANTSLLLGLENGIQTPIRAISNKIAAGEKSVDVISITDGDRTNKELEFRSAFVQLRNSCNALVDASHNACDDVGVSTGGTPGAVACSSTVPGCSQVSSDKISLDSKKSAMKSEIDTALNNPPTLTVNTSSNGLKNHNLNLKLNVTNQGSLTNPYFQKSLQQNLGGFYLETYVFDFATNSLNGQSTRDDDKGPNREDRKNQLVITFNPTMKIKVASASGAET